MVKTVKEEQIYACMLLLISMLILTFNIKPVEASGTIYIRADGSIDPPTANITTADNVTYTLTGNISSDANGIAVQRDNIVVDGAGYILQRTGTRDSTGISLSYRNNVTLKNVKVTNFFHGISLRSSSNNVLAGNNASDSLHGIFLEGGNNNTFTGNIASNNGYGISLHSSSDNTFFHNDFIDNTQQVYDYSWDHPEYPNSINSWDDGYPSGGNYWSDQNPPDLYSGPYQNETGRDGIGDLPYIIDGNNTDRYPLIYPFGCVPSPDINGDGIVDIVDITICALALWSQPGHPKWNPIVDLNQDGVIDIIDLVTIGVNFGETL